MQGHILILLCAALLPPMYLLHVVYKLDRVEPEPMDLLIRLFIYGVLCALPVIVLEMWGQDVADQFQNNAMLYSFLSYFAIPGFIEEGMNVNGGAKVISIARTDKEDEPEDGDGVPTDAAPEEDEVPSAPEE